MPKHWLKALLVWVLVCAAVFHLAQQQAQRQEREAEVSALARVAVAAAAVEQSVHRLLEATEGLHEMVQAHQTMLEVGNEPAVSLIETQLANVAHRGRFGVQQVAVIDANGWLTWSSVPQWGPTDLSDREHFRVQRDNNPGLYISPPLIGRATGRRSLQFTRALHDQADSFAGVAVVSVDPILLGQELGDLRFGASGSALVLRRDGVVLARSRDAERALGQRLAADHPLLPAAAAAPVGTLQVQRSAFDDKAKLIGYRVIGDTPLLVAVALDTEAELAQIVFARRHLMATAAAMALLTLAMAIVTLLWLERRSTQADLERARQERETVLEQLAHTQRMEALGRLAGGVAHDFNNILQSVLGGARLISRRAEDAASVRRLAGMITESANRGASVTRRLLAFARRSELRAELIDIPGLLQGLREVLAHTLGKDIEVRIHWDGELPPIRSDRGHLETVLVNLSVNARDAMAPLGGGVLTISAQSDMVRQDDDPHGLKPGEYLRLSVRDSGTGMDAATLARAAEPFFTTKPKAQGTGLGLAMAKGFAEQSGGGFHIASQPGAGTIVTLWLPRAAAGAEAAQAPTGAPASASPSAALRLLLVDDEPAVRITLAEDLAMQGCEVRQVAGGQDALAILDKGQHFDLLVTDLAMPGMDGLTLIREARRRLPELPALLISGHAGEAPQRLFGNAAAGGPFALLHKPVSADDLRIRAEMLLHSVTRKREDTPARLLEPTP